MKILSVVFFLLVYQFSIVAQLHVQSLNPHGIAAVYVESIPQEGLIKNVNKTDKTKFQKIKERFRLDEPNLFNFLFVPIFKGH